MMRIGLGVVLALLLGIGGWYGYQEHAGPSNTLPRWQSMVSPGPLSKAHAFLETTCESCHVPREGVSSVSCIGCHADAMAALAKQNTAFHAEVRDCQGCHVEHLGVNRRPTAMDHAFLITAGAKRAATPPAAPETPPSDQAVAWIAQALRDYAGTTPPTAPATPAERAALACKDCHTNQDRHRGRLGQACADCHGTQAWTIPAFLHPSPRSQDCAQCHAAPPSHYMEGHFSMLKQMTKLEHVDVSKCQACHRTNSWNDIKGMGMFDMH